MRNLLLVAGPQHVCGRDSQRSETSSVFWRHLSSLHGIMSLSIELMFRQEKALRA
jgi:hypothetical protein